ncbi:hypothetical protein HMPREF1635_01160 [Clostridiales bacterium S5-A14a]|nr:hypothetical protein HMPREF1635_01160 [Clostridiales bacterium S5-A14a]
MRKKCTLRKNKRISTTILILTLSMVFVFTMLPIHSLANESSSMQNDTNLNNLNENLVPEPAEIGTARENEDINAQKENSTNKSLSENGLNAQDIEQNEAQIREAPRKAPPENGIVEIGSFEDLKPYLEKGKYTYLTNRDYSALLLKSGNYVFTKDIEIDLNDPYFDDKSEEIGRGIISHDNKDGILSIDGGNHKITFKGNKVAPLFAGIRAKNVNISNMSVEYPTSVSGYGFIGELISFGTPVDENGFDINSSILKNIKVKVNGNVESKEVWGNVILDNHFSDQFGKGQIASGLSWYLSKTSLEDIDLEVTGNIGSDKAPADKNFRSGATGLTFHWDKKMPTKDTPSGDEIYMKQNTAMLKKAGQIVNVNVNIGGNIQAYAYSQGYSAGVSNDLGEAWVDNLHVNIKGNILTKLHKGGINQSGGESTYAHGISDEIGTFINSSLDVNNIVIDAENGMAKSNDFTQMYLVASTNSKGWAENLSNNKFNVRGKMSNNAPFRNTMGLGFGNGWNSSGKYGVDFLQTFENNEMQVGAVEIKNAESSQTAFVGLSQKVYAGKQSYEGRPELPEASLKNNSLKVGKVDIDTPKAYGMIYPFMMQATNSKDNTVSYGDINCKTDVINFIGMGDVEAKQPKNTPHQCLTKGNKLEFGTVKLEGNTGNTISLMAGAQGANQPIEDCSVKAKALSVNLTDENENKYSTSIAGIATYQQAPIKGCRVYVGDIDIKNQTQKTLYLGLGTAFSKNSKIEGSAVFIDKDFKLDTAGTKYAGGFAGYASNMTIDNCDYQINGKSEVAQNGKGIFAGFAGWIKNTTISNSRSLILNDWAVFTGFADGGTIDGVAHYINKPNPKFWSAILGAHKENKPTIKNSTLLVDKENKDTWLYRTGNVSDESNDNYVTVVGKGTDNVNREVYKTSENEITENGKTVKVVSKNDDSIGNGFVAKRAFQTKYWNAELGAYATSDAEKNFGYLLAASFDKKEAVGVDAAIVSKDLQTASLMDYYNRHVGIKAKSGAYIDLLGIKGDDFAFTPSVTKKVIGHDSEENYSFVLKADKDNPTGGTDLNGDIKKSTNGKIEDGKTQKIDFDEISFTKLGTYKFIVKEVNQAPKDWIYDNSEKVITVVISENKDGKFKVKIENNNPVVENKYSHTDDEDKPNPDKPDTEKPKDDAKDNENKTTTTETSKISKSVNTGDNNSTEAMLTLTLLIASAGVLVAVSIKNKIGNKNKSN